MSIPRNVADIIQNHVSPEGEGIDRMCLNVYQPKLQMEKGAACIFCFHRNQPVAFSSLMASSARSCSQQARSVLEFHGLAPRSASFPPWMVPVSCQTDDL
jgi:hypothetical protein